MVRKLCDNTIVVYLVCWGRIQSRWPGRPGRLPGSTSCLLYKLYLMPKKLNNSTLLSYALCCTLYFSRVSWFCTFFECYGYLAAEHSKSCYDTGKPWGESPHFTDCFAKTICWMRVAADFPREGGGRRHGSSPLCMQRSGPINPLILFLSGQQEATRELTHLQVAWGSSRYNLGKYHF